ncbi:hypothetical protein E2562_001973 [Oryza meyeriana var. granulata]|uniref:Uncharacterized protein n=1 Tax=Oryza meyeriana var. granulata TaxID=110450 RepID=A0A6G1C3B1_9ORYZ|nr:hypothetical protein E2562_001973 [Oryza meyeriana var. granulata]
MSLANQLCHPTGFAAFGAVGFSSQTRDLTASSTWPPDPARQGQGRESARVRWWWWQQEEEGSSDGNYEEGVGGDSDDPILSSSLSMIPRAQAGH